MKKKTCLGLTEETWFTVLVLVATGVLVAVFETWPHLLFALAIVVCGAGFIAWIVKGLFFPDEKDKIYFYFPPPPPP
jgi:hypothetical protein